MTGGFFSRWSGWIGLEPMTEDRQATIDAANIAVAHADAERRAEALRPTVERVSEIKAELVALVPQALADDVRATAAEQARLHGVVLEATRALAAHLEHEPTEEAQLDAWLQRRAELETRIPFLRRFETRANVAANAALERARQSIAPFAAEQKQAAGESRDTLREEARRVVEEAQLTFVIVSQACALATTLTVNDLESEREAG